MNRRIVLISDTCVAASASAYWSRGCRCQDASLELPLACLPTAASSGVEISELVVRDGPLLDSSR